MVPFDGVDILCIEMIEDICQGSLAVEAALQTGLPVCVLVIEPGGNWSMISGRPSTAESGNELLMPLPEQIRSGVTP